MTLNRLEEERIRNRNRSMNKTIFSNSLLAQQGSATKGQQQSSSQVTQNKWTRYLQLYEKDQDQRRRIVSMQNSFVEKINLVANPVVTKQKKRKEQSLAFVQSRL